MQRINVDELVSTYDLEPHPEGGFYKETYRAAKVIANEALPSHAGARNYSTGIYYLLPAGSHSKLHRIQSDEMWHFYLGDPMTIVQISPEGAVETVLLGHDVQAGHKVQHVVPAGYWFGAYPNEGSEYAFVGCTVAPGFDFADFEFGHRDEMLQQYPHAQDIIERLGHE